MTVVGDRLAAAQVRGHRDLDAIYRALAAAIHAAILRRATPDARGILRLSLPARFAILSDLGRLLDQYRPLVFGAILHATTEAERVAQIGAEPLPRDFTTTRVALFDVAPALRTDRASVISQTGALLVRGIAGRVAARKIAQTVREYFYKRDPATGLIQLWPGRANMASQHARLVMLTETTAAHGRTMKRIAERDHTGLKWNLSPSHQEADACNEHASRDMGYGRGVYPVADFPKLPEHPRCRCFASSMRIEPAERLRF